MKKTCPACVLASIADDPAYNEILTVAKNISTEYALPLIAVTVLPSGQISDYTSKRVQTLYNIAERHGAELLVLFNDNPALSVAVTAQQKNAAHLVFGPPRSGRFIEIVKAILPEIPFTIAAKNIK